MTSEVRSEKVTQLSSGFLRTFAQPPCNMFNHPETVVLETPHVGASVDSPSGAHTSSHPHKGARH